MSTSRQIHTRGLIAVLARSLVGTPCPETRLALAAAILESVLDHHPDPGAVTLGRLYMTLESQSRGGQLIEELLTELRSLAEERPAVTLIEFAREAGVA